MKTSSLFVTCVLALTFHFGAAQKQSSGDHSLELQVAPLGSEPVKKLAEFVSDILRMIKRL